MRFSIFALLVSLPVTGFAQTPRDLAQLSFGQNVPAVLSQAPGEAVVGGATAQDLARLSGGAGVSVAGSGHVAVATGFTGADVARLRGDGVASFDAGLAGLRIVAAERPHG
ncbi:MAG: hypothetical protein WDN04_02225 [Rhodospirillales bacterium]